MMKIRPWIQVIKLIRIFKHGFIKKKKILKDNGSLTIFVVRVPVLGHIACSCIFGLNHKNHQSTKKLMRKGAGISQIINNCPDPK